LTSSPHASRPCDALVIGGGFFGTTIATYLAEQRGFKQVVLIERETGLLTRASYVNQARVHNGYHYPRSLVTAFRSRVNLPRFVQLYPEAVKRDFTKLYAIARQNSKVSARQFERFCQQIGAVFEPAPEALRSLFEPRTVEASYLVEEFAFDATILRAAAEDELRRNGVEIRLGTTVTGLRPAPNGALRAEYLTASGEPGELSCRYVFNCTYSGLNQFTAERPEARVALKHEIAELALVEAPLALRGLGVTVMDGPFFSMMPFPARGLHSLTHVRYTPHLDWLDESGIDPHARLAAYAKATRADRMMRDVARFMPAVTQASYQDSIFEVKTVLTRNESDDGRPIHFQRHAPFANCYTVLGGKIDNVFDMLEILDLETLSVGG